MEGDPGMDCVMFGRFADDPVGLRLGGTGGRDFADRALTSVALALDWSELFVEDAPIETDDDEFPRTRPARRGGGGGGAFAFAFEGD